MDTKTTKNADVIIEYLADKCIREILNLTTKKEHSALELSSELNTPLSTVYRRLKLLEKSGLIQHVKTVISYAGNEEKYYRCIVREATVSFKDGELSVDIKKEDCCDKFIRFWKKLADSNDKEIK